MRNETCSRAGIIDYFRDYAYDVNATPHALQQAEFSVFLWRHRDDSAERRQTIERENCVIRYCGFFVCGPSMISECDLTGVNNKFHWQQNAPVYSHNFINWVSRCMQHMIVCALSINYTGRFVRVPSSPRSWRTVFTCFKDFFLLLQ